MKNDTCPDCRRKYCNHFHIADGNWAHSTTMAEQNRLDCLHASLHRLRTLDDAVLLLIDTTDAVSALFGSYDDSPPAPGEHVMEDQRDAYAALKALVRK